MASIHTHAEGEAGQQGVDAVELPAAERPIHGTRPIAAPALPTTDGQLVQRAEDHGVVLVDARTAPLDLIVRIELRVASIRIAARIIDRLGPRKRAEELQTLGEPPFVLRLHRIVVGRAPIVLHGDAAKLGVEAARRIGGRNSVKLLVSVVVLRQVLPFGANVSQAGGAVCAKLALYLQIPLRDVGSPVVQQNGKHADSRRAGEIQVREVPARQGAIRLRGIKLRLRAGRLAGQRPAKSDAIPIRITDGVLAAERRILCKLIADAAAVDEIEETISAAKDGLAIVCNLIGETRPWPEVVVIVLDQAARVAVLAREKQRSCGEVKVCLAVLHFDRPREYVVSQAQVQSQPRSDAPVVLDEDAVFPAPRSHHAVICTVGIRVHEAGQNIGDFVSRIHMISLSPIPAEEEVTFARKRPVKVKLASQDVGTGLQRVLTPRPCERVVIVVAGLRDQIWSIVTGVLDLVVIAAN